MTKAFAWIGVAYAAALAVAIAVGRHVDAPSPLWTALWADVAGTCVVFAFSVAFRNSSFYDAYWSVAPLAIVVYWLQVADPGASAERQGLVALLVFAWGIRLTGNWARGWTGLDHEDWRYVDLQEKTGRLYWLVSFGGIHMLPTLWVFGGCLALYPALVTGTHDLGWLDGVALIVTGTAIWLEFQADQELRRFRTDPARRPADVLDTGLWSLSRHPNYLGEMGFWWGLWLFALAADPGWWWTVIGPLAITLMFRFASLPMIETRMIERRPERFAAYQRTTPMVLPWPRPSGSHRSGAWGTSRRADASTPRPRPCSASTPTTRAGRSGPGWATADSSARARPTRTARAPCARSVRPSSPLARRCSRSSRPAA